MTERPPPAAMPRAVPVPLIGAATELPARMPTLPARLSIAAPERAISDTDVLFSETKTTPAARRP